MTYECCINLSSSLSQVNELENRVCVIENKNSVDLPKNVWETSCFHHFIDYATSISSSNYQFLHHKDLTLKTQPMLSDRHRFTGSFDDLKPHQTTSSGSSFVAVTPEKQKQAFSLPATPSIGSSLPHSEVSRKDGRSTSPVKSAIVIEPMTQSEIQSMSRPITSTFSPRKSNSKDVDYKDKSGKHNQKRQNCNLIGEIDQFLNSVTKNPKVDSLVTERNQKENPHVCGDNSSSIPDLGFGLKDLNKLPVREEPVQSKYIVPLQKEETRPISHSDLNQFDNLLKGTQNDNGRGDSKSLHKGLCKQNTAYACGDNTASVPDLSFGLRDFNHLPVREEVIQKKTISPLESSTTDPEMKGLELSDIEKLLRQMESTQREIEKKLQLRETLLGKGRDSVLAPQKTFLEGDITDSVPDRGFGIRSILNSSKSAPQNISGTSENGTRIPVHEEPVIKKKISLLGNEITSDITECSQQQKHIEQNTDNQSISYEDTWQTTSNLSEKHNPEQDNMTKQTIAKRKLELGGDPATIPDLGFGLKSWYQNTQDEAASGNRAAEAPEPLPHSSINIPHYLHGDITTSDSIYKTLPVSFKCKDNYIQGDYLSSVPDLGFGIRSLWANNSLDVGTSSHILKPLNPSAKNQQVNAKDNLDAVEYPLLSQVEPHKDGAHAHSNISHQTIGDQTNKMYTQHQTNMTSVEERSKLTDAVMKKKVDFIVGSGRNDAVTMQEEQGATKSSAEGIRNKPEYRSYLLDSGISTSVGPGATSLLSLSDLWGKDGSSSTSYMNDDYGNVRLKLEEEKYRRQHCERLIQQLQIRLLEEQQKLAVAVRVDRGKDQAILQLKDAWTRLVHHWKELEEQRHSLASILQNEREIYQKQEREIAHKLKRLETELSTALDLAQGYKDKVDTLEKEKLELIERNNNEIKKIGEKIEKREKELHEAKQLNCQIVEQKEESLKKMKQAEEDAQKERKLLIETQKELENLHKKLDTFEAEVAALKEEKETLQLKLKEEKGRITILDQQKKSLQTTLDENKKKEKSLREEMKLLTAQSEKIKVELREYYQEQLEVVVRDKLREFQEQLDAAEVSLHKELEQREHAITDLASRQVKQISEKHQMEVQLLEEKHSEELQLYKLQLAQAMNQITELETKLQGYNSRKSELVEKLHSVMETQWQEALRIISGNSPLVSHNSELLKLQGGIDSSTKPLVMHNQPICLDKTGPFYDLKTQSCNESHIGKNDADTELKEARLSKHCMFEASKNGKVVTNPSSAFKNVSVPQPLVPPIHLHQQSNGSSTADEMPFCRDGLLTYRVAEQPVQLQETPPGRGQMKTNQENELKKYIMMLLDRSPGDPLDEGNQEVTHKPDPHDGNSGQDKPSRYDKREGLPSGSTNEGIEPTKWEKILHSDAQVSLSNGRNQNFTSIPSYELPKTGNSSGRDSRQMKPPWK
ncbi:putative leucine-rich repeat-containing protein DDB_G0290503 isoform X2 [Periplaneta americana]|uniref:putative leucine-rich repeat-containing protein DDB_G0290503 isoform X2 n=1 Tax=Periplaneta americana TaxID=6978 RepID=UPI0037E77E10